MKAIDKNAGNVRKRLLPALRNAEKETVINVFDEVCTGLWEYCRKYRTEKK
ncbi:hypothetical protein KTO58_24750 [Chitinophaga pendula]|uniref:hypothetical protein n=1 Tax=Chitinophaga TaxID=79328 RepID=UPI0012FE2DD0|nr:MULTISPECIES: hypothetical protein [Chitinophaga]UCJ06838.1 hypothetical protein KTO58_24750 [Chitinophaga pendula]